CVQTVQTPLTF
nr:immunoglobulin light chain junction region [Macaca mulatta]